jgi:hypothetical protein
MRSRWFALSYGLVVACSSTKSHAPFLAGDTPGRGGFGASSSTTIPPDSGSGTVVAGQGTGTLTGEASVFRDIQFDAVDPFTGNGVIVVQGVHSVPGTLSGTNFTVDHTDRSKNLWVSIREQIDSGTGALMPTITPVDGTSTNVGVAFVKTSVMTEIAQLLTPIPPALTSPALDPINAAQVLVRFVDGSGAALPGIQLSLKTNVLYDSPSGSTYTDAPPTHTNSRGIAIVVNLLTAAPFPGAKTQLRYQVPPATTTVPFDVVVAQGAVTIATVAVPP